MRRGVKQSVGAMISSIQVIGASRPELVWFMIMSLLFTCREKTRAHATYINVDKVLSDLWNMGSENVLSISVISRTP